MGLSKIAAEVQKEPSDISLLDDDEKKQAEDLPEIVLSPLELKLVDMVMMFNVSIVDASSRY